MSLDDKIRNSFVVLPDPLSVVSDMVDSSTVYLARCISKSLDCITWLVFAYFLYIFSESHELEFLILNFYILRHYWAIGLALWKSTLKLINKWHSWNPNAKSSYHKCMILLFPKWSSQHPVPRRELTSCDPWRMDSLNFTWKCYRFQFILSLKAFWKSRVVHSANHHYSLP